MCCLHERWDDQYVKNLFDVHSNVHYSVVVDQHNHWKL